MDQNGYEQFSRIRMTTGKMSWLAERQRVLAKYSEFRYAGTNSI